MRDRLGVIIPWCNRPELELTLRRNRDIFAEHASSVTVVNCGGDREQMSQIIAAANLPALSALHIDAEHFNKCLALNLGAWVTASERLFLLDTDIILSKNCLSEMLAVASSGRCAYVKRVYDSARMPSARKARDLPGMTSLAYSITVTNGGGRKAVVELNRTSFRNDTRAGPGLILLYKSDFVAVGGMNSSLIGWGWEDVDLLIRLQLLLGMRLLRRGSVTHLAHGNDLRFFGGNSPMENEARNSSICLENYRRGMFYGTLESDVEDFFREGSRAARDHGHRAGS